MKLAVVWHHWGGDQVYPGTPKNVSKQTILTNSEWRNKVWGLGTYATNAMDNVATEHALQSLLTIRR
jgi:hypothetical protein